MVCVVQKFVLGNKIMETDLEKLNICENCKYAKRVSCNKFKCQIKGFFLLTRYVSGSDTCKYFSMIKHINKKQLLCARHECKVATSVRSVSCPCTTCNGNNCHVCDVADKQVNDSVDSLLQGIPSSCEVCRALTINKTR